VLPYSDAVDDKEVGAAAPEPDDAFSVAAPTPEELEEVATRGGSGALLVRIAISVVLLAILISNVPDLDGVFPAHGHRRTFGLIAAALGVTLVGVLLSAWRWQRVLAAYHERVPLGVLASHYLAGLFVGNVLPSTIGGDVLRVSRAARSTGSTEVAFGSVVLERLTGFFALPFLVGVGFVVDPSIAGHPRAWLALTIAGITLGALGVVLTVAASPRLAGRFREHLNWMRFVGAVHVGVQRIRLEPGHALSVLSSAVIYQASVVAAVTLLAAALNLGVSWGEMLVVVPVVAMVQVLPLSISGLGVREGMLVLFLSPLGPSSAQAIALGLLWYASMLGVSMLGAPAFAVGHRHRATVGADPDRWRLRAPARGREAE
jgi:uncharacterized membrane protein YbhN (UPF0104 family)